VFGIPGDTITAVLIGAFMAQGLLPGPLLFQQHGPVLYGFFAILLITNVLLLGLGLVAIRHLGRIAALPPGVLYPAVAVFCVAGAFAVNSSMFDIGVMLAGGLAGFAMRRLDVPIPPLVISMLLAPSLENALRQSLLLSNNDLTIFFTRPIAAGLSVLLAMVLAGLIWRGRGRQSAAPAHHNN